MTKQYTEEEKLAVVEKLYKMPREKAMEILNKQLDPLNTAFILGWMDIIETEEKGKPQKGLDVVGDFRKRSGYTEDVSAEEN